MSEQQVVARSPITAAAPHSTLHGWRVSTRASKSSLTIVDESPRAKVSLRATHSGAAANAIGVPFGRAVRDTAGSLVIGSGPGEWLVLGEIGAEAELLASWRRALVDAAARELVSTVDLTHGRALIRLHGNNSAALLSKLCAVDLGADMAPNGAAFRSSVARLVTDVIRDDSDGVTSFLVHCERSSGQYLFDALLDAGAEFGIDVDGFGRTE